MGKEKGSTGKQYFGRLIKTVEVFMSSKGYESGDYAVDKLAGEEWT
jgi:hypothetical protein